MKTISARQDANRKIIEILTELVNDLPQQRFGQILYNYILEHDVNGQVFDPFFEESTAMLNRISTQVGHKTESNEDNI